MRNNNVKYEVRCRRFKHDHQKLVSHFEERIKNWLKKSLKSFKHFDLHGEKLRWAAVGIMQHQENHSIVSLSCIVINWSRPKLSNITNAKVCYSVLMSNSKCNPLFTRHVQFLSISTNAKWHLPFRVKVAQSQKVLHFGSNLPKKAKNYALGGECSGAWFGTFFFGDWKRRYFFSEIKPPLVGSGSRLASGGGPLPYS